MSSEQAALCSRLLGQYFGSTVQMVGTYLNNTFSRTLWQITTATGLSLTNVRNALTLLIEFQLVTYSTSESDVTVYSLIREDVLYLMRYPRYIQQMRQLYGETHAAIVQEILAEGSDFATSILIKCMKKVGNVTKLEIYRAVFLKLVEMGYLESLPLVPPDDNDYEDYTELVPIRTENPNPLFNPSDVDLNFIGRVIEEKVNLTDAKDAAVFWKLNLPRFHQDMRDNLMTSAIDRKLGKNASECFSCILSKMYETSHPWQRRASNPFFSVDLKHAVERTCQNWEVYSYLEQYLKLLENDSLGFIRKLSDAGGGQYSVQFFQAFEELAMICIEQIIMERYGSKSARIFRIIRAKKYIEQEDLQKEAMLAAKDTKARVLGLFAEQLLQIKSVRRGVGSTNYRGPAKTYYLLHINSTRVVQTVLDICYKSLCNVIDRALVEKHPMKSLFTRSERIAEAVRIMRDRGDSMQDIKDVEDLITPPEKTKLRAIEEKLCTTTLAQYHIDETIFILQMYLYHTSTLPYRQLKRLQKSI